LEDVRLSLSLYHWLLSVLLASVGRQDDVLTLSTGEKTVPAPIEDAIVKDKRIRSAVLFGRGRDQVGVLIEPAKYDEDSSAFIDSVWPTIEAATADSPAFSRIFKHMVLVTKEDKPMLRADKGTLKKKATIATFTEEIDAL
jgi:long-subunit acyl-CoA synthetase (AMP-forming)